ncbi:MAG: hypothetical protein ACJ73L_01100 [Actinomycetes bacterium]
MSKRKNPGAVEDADAAVDSPVEAIEPGFDPELDQVPSEEFETAADVDAESGEIASADEDGGSRGEPNKVKILLGATIALVVAAVAVVVAGALGGSDKVVLPETVGDPAVIINALDSAGIACSGTAVSGQVATCNATVAFRIFDSTAEAQTYVKGMLKDPLTSSAIGWVRHGNVVVASPLTATPEIASALGGGSQIY